VRVTERALLLFSKPARPGYVKTRLVGPGLSSAAAARLHAAFLGDLAARLAHGPFDLIPYWDLGGAELPLPADPPGGRAQADGDLGRRLFEAFRSLAASHRLAAAIGSDHPELPLERVSEAFEALERGADLVLGPALDGGYYLIALRPDRASNRLFESIAWSTPSVLEATRERAVELGLETRLLPPAADVDTRADLDRLAARLEALPALCPRTYAELRDLGWIGAEGRCAS
jgi:rSAM/selenodomain-associated transferase 1